MDADLKRRLRKLKHFEIRLRKQNNMQSDTALVWDKFFDLNKIPKNKALYTLEKLAEMSREEYKATVDAFFARIYYELYIYKGFINDNIYDPELLAQLGLPPLADEAAVKKRFRELAKKYHPDSGGDPEKFIELMKVYRELY